jgi:hypothetical protein
LCGSGRFVEGHASHRANESAIPDLNRPVLHQNGRPLERGALFRVGFDGDAEDGPGGWVQRKRAVITGPGNSGLDIGRVAQLGSNPRDSMAAFEVCVFLGGRLLIADNLVARGRLGTE